MFPPTVPNLFLSLVAGFVLASYGQTPPPCAPGSVWSATQQDCRCADGFEANPQGECAFTASVESKVHAKTDAAPTQTALHLTGSDIVLSTLDQSDQTSVYTVSWREFMLRVDQEHNEIVNVVNTSVFPLETFKREAEYNLESLDLRMDVLENDIFAWQTGTSLIGNGNFVNGQHAVGYRADGSYGNYQLVSLQNDVPPNGATHGIRFGVGGGAEYEVEVRPDAHPLCAGTYRLALWAKVSSDFAGSEQLLHARFYGAGANGQDVSISRFGPASGGWPSGPDVWQRLSTTFTIPREATGFLWYVGFPMSVSAGTVLVTGLDMRLLAPAGSCATPTPLKSVTDVVEAVQADFELFKNGSEFNLESLDRRVEHLEDMVFFEMQQASLISNGNFDSQTNAGGYDASQSRGKFELVSIEDIPAPNGATSAIQFNPDAATTILSEYEIGLSSPSTPLCAGTYRLAAYVRYSSDHVGVPQVFHARFGGMQDQGPVQIAPQGAASGGWPSGPDRWEFLTVTIEVPKDAAWMRWYIGYPMQLRRGNVWVTGISLRRLGPDGGRCPENVLRRDAAAVSRNEGCQRCQERVDELESTLSGMQRQLDALQQRLLALET